MSDAAQDSATITIYSTPWCAFCKTEKQWLDSMGIPYVSKDIEEDEGAKDELLAKLDGVFKGVPTTDIGGEIIVGFDRPKLQAAIAAKGIAPQT